MQSTREFVDSVARRATALPMYLQRTHEIDGPFYRALCSLIGERVRQNQWTMISCNGSQRACKLFVSDNSLSFDSLNWSTLVFYGGVEGIRIVFMERQHVAVDAWRRMLLLVATEVSIIMPTCLGRIVSSADRGPGQLHRFINELLTREEPARWVAHLVDCSLISQALDFIDAQFPRVRPFESDNRPPISLPLLPLSKRLRTSELSSSSSSPPIPSDDDDIDMLSSSEPANVRDVRRQLPPSLPIYGAYTRALRSVFIVRLLCEYIVARPYKSTSLVAGSLVDGGGGNAGGSSPHQLGITLSYANIDKLCERAESHECYEHRTPAMFDTPATPVTVQQMYEFVVVLAQHIRQDVPGSIGTTATTTTTKKWWSGLRTGFDKLPRLAKMAAHAFNWFLIHDPSSMSYEELENTAKQWGDETERTVTDVKVFGTLIYNLVAIPTLVRYHHVDTTLVQAFTTFTRVVVLTGTARASALARQLDMALQMEALERISNIVTRTSLSSYVTLMPSTYETTVWPTALELGTVVRHVSSGAREGIDFVIVWSPHDTSQYALVVTKRICERLLYDWTPRLLLSSSKPPPGGNRGDVIARILDIYAKKECSWQSAAAVLATTATVLIGCSDVICANSYRSALHVDSMIVRINSVLKRLCNSTFDLVVLLYMMLLGKRMSMWRLFEVLFTPRAYNVFFAMSTLARRESPPPFLRNALPIWESFFASVPDTVDTRRQQRLADIINVRRHVMPLTKFDDNSSSTVRRNDDAADNNNNNNTGDRFVEHRFDIDEFDAITLARLQTYEPSDKIQYGAVGVHGTSFLASDVGHTMVPNEPRAPMRAASRARIESHDAQLHLDIIDCALSHTTTSQKLAMILRNLRVVAVADRDPYLFRTPIDPKSRLTVVATTVNIPTSTTISECAAKLRDTTDLNVQMLVRIWTAVADGLAVVTESVDVDTADIGVLTRDSRLRSILVYVADILAKDNHAYASDVLGVSQSQFVGTQSGCRREINRLVVDEMPRALAFAQPFLVEGALTNFFYAIAE